MKPRSASKFLEQKKEFFIENRLNDSVNDLEKAEEELKNFHEKNRNITASPALMLESGEVNKGC